MRACRTANLTRATSRNLTLVREDAPQRTHDLREVFNGLRWIVRTLSHAESL